MGPKSDHVRLPKDLRTGAVPHLPAAGTGPGAAWEMHGQAKCRLAAPEFYWTIDGLKAGVSEHPRACAIKAGVHACLMRGA